jgi:hypothetical protein
LRESCLHLRIEEAGGSLSNGDGAVESRVGVQHSKVVLEDGSQVEGQFLGVHVGSEAVGGSLLLAGRDQEVVLGDGQVVDGLGAHERATDEAKVNRSRLMVGDGQDSVGRVAIDKLDTKDLRVGERYRDIDVQLGGLLDIRVLHLLYSLRSLYTSLAGYSQLLAIGGGTDLSVGRDSLQCKERECAELQRYHSD